MRRKILLIFFGLLIGSQLFAQYEQVPFCPQRNISIYTLDDDKVYSLFSNYPGFQQAMVFRIDSSTYKLLIFYRNKDKLVLDEKILNQSQLDTLLNSLCVTSDSAGTLDRSGRVRFLIGSAIASLAGYGWMVPMYFDLYDKAFIAAYAITSGLGIFIPNALVKKRSITRAEAMLKNYGQLNGFINGVLLGSAFGIENENLFLISMLGSIGQGFAGYIIADKKDLDFDQAYSAVDYSIIGGLLAYDLAMIIARSSDWNVGNWIYILPVIGQYIGFGSALALNDVGKKNVPRYGQISNLDLNKKITRGDAIVLNGIVFYSAAWGVNMRFITHRYAEDYDIWVFVPAFAGTIGGTMFIKKYNFTRSQGVLSNLVALGAGLITTGVVVLILPWEVLDKYPQIYTTTFLTTATVTYGLMLRRYIKKNSQLSNISMKVKP